VRTLRAELYKPVAVAYILIRWLFRDFVYQSFVLQVVFLEQSLLQLDEFELIGESNPRSAQAWLQGANTDSYEGNCSSLPVLFQLATLNISGSAREKRLVSAWVNPKTKNSNAAKM
jgi:hypothetical protein